MKILHLIDTLAPGGAERVMVNACNWLHEAGCEVEAVVLTGRRADLADALHKDIPLHVLNRRRRADWKAASQLAALMRRADIVHAHMRHNYRYVALAATIFGLKTKLVLHDHYGLIHVDQSVPVGIKSVFKPDWYIGVSQELVDWATGRLALANKQVFLLTNAVDALDSAPQPPQGDLVLVSNFKPVKNQKFALELLEKLEYRLDLYGVAQDLDYARMLHDFIRTSDLVGRVRCISDCTNVQSLLGAYRLGLHTSMSETGPLAVIEYLAQGLPFLAYRTGAAADLIGRDFPEFFIDHFEPEAWAERIRQLLAAPPDRERMARVFERHFSKQRYVSQCLEIYRHILAS